MTSSVQAMSANAAMANLARQLLVRSASIPGLPPEAVNILGTLANHPNLRIDMVVHAVGGPQAAQISGTTSHGRLKSDIQVTVQDDELPFSGLPIYTREKASTEAEETTTTAGGGSPPPAVPAPRKGRK